MRGRIRGWRLEQQTAGRNIFKGRDRVQLCVAAAAIREVSLPLNGAFFRGVDFGEVRSFAEEEALNVVEEKILRVGVG